MAWVHAVRRGRESIVSLVTVESASGRLQLKLRDGPSGGAFWEVIPDENREKFEAVMRWLNGGGKTLLEVDLVNDIVDGVG